MANSESILSEVARLLLEEDFITLEEEIKMLCLIREGGSDQECVYGGQ